eukprot:CAMPEP_0170492690 /NCGR_PEP_ID=MMETSP0208-20121228/12656_1 /TAXON_ID=197538 /ORGANISM="Strombidium inclinatum, Strain S3" /LENGTH=85 /DNA_ID=CAMNT_0010768469 /DNA_START=12 /DNA_END=269 /DNA_ORIENTATION=+
MQVFIDHEEKALKDFRECYKRTAAEIRESGEVPEIGEFCKTEFIKVEYFLEFGAYHYNQRNANKVFLPEAQQAAFTPQLPFFQSM